jgi:tetratricopeptide (TPR) repeat protein
LYLLRGSAYAQLGAALKKAIGPDEAAPRFDDAEADFRKALALIEGPASASTPAAGFHEALRWVLLNNRGVARFQRGDYRAAAADFEAAVALDAGRYNAYASWAQALRKLGRSEEAVQRLDDAILRAPEVAALYRDRALSRLDRDARHQVEAALRDLQTAARLDGSPAGAADDHRHRGRLLLHLGRPADALAAADAALRLAPDSAGAHVVRIEALLQLERFDDMIGSCENALAKGPVSAELYYWRGLARERRGDLAGAIDDYTKALGLRPENRAEIHRLRGWAYIFRNAFELAERDFEAILALDANDPEGHAGRAVVRARGGQIADALADAEKSLDRAGTSPRLSYIAAQTYALASTLAAARMGRRGDAAARDARDYEARASELLGTALDRMSPDQRSSLQRLLARDPWLRPLLRDPQFLRRLPQATGLPSRKAPG